MDLDPLMGVFDGVSGWVFSVRMPRESRIYEPAFGVLEKVLFVAVLVTSAMVVYQQDAYEENLPATGTLSSSSGSTRAPLHFPEASQKFPKN